MTFAEEAAERMPDRHTFLKGWEPRVTLGDTDGECISAPTTEETDEDSLLIGWRLDPDEWRIIDGTLLVNRWQTKAADGPATWLYQYKARVARRRWPKVDLEALISQALNTYWTLYGPTSATRATPRPAPFTWAYGPDTSTSLGVTLTPGAANAKGSWAQLTATTDGPISAIAVGIQGAGISAMQGGTVLVDIARGAAGSEVVILPNLGFVTTTQELVYRTHMLTTHPVDLPAGVRLAARCSNSGGSTAPYYVDASVCAIPRSG